MLLKKSGGHPLDLIIPHSASTPRPIRYSHALDASAHTSRIRRFLFDLGRGGKDVKHIVRIFSKPAPNLTHLQLNAHLILYPGVKPFPDLFGLEFPNLGVLEVVEIEAWPKIVGANLTHITIRVSLNPWTLKDCIQHSPNLKALKIQDILNFDSPNFGGWERIALAPGVCLTIRRTHIFFHILALFKLPHDGHIRISPHPIQTPKMSLLSHVLPADTSHLQNLRMLTRLHMKTRIDVWVALELKCCRLDQPALEVDVEYSFENQTVVQQKASPVMWFLSNLNRVTLRGVEELRMDGFVGRLEPQAAELRAFLTRMPALTRVITTNSNEETLRSALDSLGYRAVVVRVEE